LYSHEPPGYECPFCSIVRGEDQAGDWTKDSDVVKRDAAATAWIAPLWWPNNAGHVIVVPNAHIENIYLLTGEHALAVHELAREVAIAMMETYGCEGTSTRQHNGPGGDQEVWHYHLHVFPRTKGDGLYGSRRRETTARERVPYAERLRGHFARG
jgi:histidine triad (HIT) family protein